MYEKIANFLMESKWNMLKCNIENHKDVLEVIKILINNGYKYSCRSNLSDDEILKDISTKYEGNILYLSTSNGMFYLTYDSGCKISNFENFMNDTLLGF